MCVCLCEVCVAFVILLFTVAHSKLVMNDMTTFHCSCYFIIPVTANVVTAWITTLKKKSLIAFIERDSAKGPV